MSRDIEATIRRHFEANDSLQTPIGQTEIVERFNTESRSVPVPARNRGYVVRVAAGAAAVTLILVGGVSLITRLQVSPVADSVTPSTLVTPSVVVPPTVAASEAPPTTTTPATTIAPLSTHTFPVWTHVQGPDGATAEGLLTTDSSGFTYCDGSFVAMSPNGIDWERTELARSVNQRDSCIAWDGVVVSRGSGGRSGGQGSGDPVVITPSVVQISQPDGDISVFRIDGTVSSTAIGGTGILISIVDNRLDPALGLGLTPEEDESVIATTDDAGILSVHFADGTTRTVDLVEVGFDVHARNLYKTYWWFSDDGVDWTLQPDRSSDEFRSSHEFHRVLGTELGFYAINYGTNPATIWFTSHGVSWEEIGAVEGEGGRLTRSGGEAILIGPERLYVLRPDGFTEYALEGLPALTIPVVGGEDGVLSVQHWNGEESELKLFGSIPGQPFELEDIPPDMESANEFGFFMPSYTVFGNRYLLLLFEDDFVPTFWMKDFPTS